MSRPSNFDAAIECIKLIVDTNRCRICDDTSGTRLRFQCGHSACDDCVASSNHCLKCVTPPDAGHISPIADSPATQRVNNVNKLMKTFQEAFDIDVYRRHRESELLKAEKEVFPECIQAPVKYFNKRKSSIPTKNKENSKPSFFPGENISPIKISKMENSFNYVQEWLEKSAKKSPQKPARRPFADLNINHQRVPKRADLILAKLKENSGKKKKQSNFKSARSLVDSQFLLDQYLKPVRKVKEFKNLKRNFEEDDRKVIGKTKTVNKSDKDESGIVIDDDDPIVIDDSQSEVIDKDKLAWQAVLEADKHSNDSTWLSKRNCSDVTHSFDIKKIPTNDHTKSEFVDYKVPFFKKGYLLETCRLCLLQRYGRQDTKKDSSTLSKDVSITIENNSTITTIKMSTIQAKPIFEKQCVSTQTEISELDVRNNQHDDMKIEKPAISQELFTVEAKSFLEHKETISKDDVEVRRSKQPPELVIADSDSDNPANESSIIEVFADVHHSRDQFEENVLSELAHNEVCERTKRSGRGHTPTSTDSSDKENFDPNRAKRSKENKKNVKRKRYESYELDGIDKF